MFEYFRLSPKNQLTSPEQNYIINVARTLSKHRLHSTKPSPTHYQHMTNTSATHFQNITNPSPTHHYNNTNASLTLHKHISIETSHYKWLANNDVSRSFFPIERILRDVGCLGACGAYGGCGAWRPRALFYFFFFLGGGKGCGGMRERYERYSFAHAPYGATP